MVEEIFLPAQVKRGVIILNKLLYYELLQELPNELDS